MPDDHDSSRRQGAEVGASGAHARGDRARLAPESGLPAVPATELDPVAEETALRRTSTPPESPQAKRGPKYLIWMVVGVLLALSIVLASVAVRLVVRLYEHGTRAAEAMAGSPGSAGPVVRVEEERSLRELAVAGRRAVEDAPEARVDAGLLIVPGVQPAPIARPNSESGYRPPRFNAGEVSAPAAASARREPFGGAPAF